MYSAAQSDSSKIVNRADSVDRVIKVFHTLTGVLAIVQSVVLVFNYSCGNTFFSLQFYHIFFASSVLKICYIHKAGDFCFFRN